MGRNNFLSAALALFSAALCLIVLAPRTLADEFTLKDGTKISGTIVGFEEDSFRVKTSYGFALVQKDQVVSIKVTEAAKSAPEKKIAAEKSAPEKASAESARASAAPAATHPAMAESSNSPATASTPKTEASAVAKNSPAPPAAPTSAPTVVATAAAPVAAPAPPAPEPIREEVSGNTYTNDTYHFRMYKPPDWAVINGARSVLPGAIAAMGTDDQTTYLLVGQEPAGKSLSSDMDTTEKRLRDVMDNFRPLSEERVTISGAAAVEHRFRGSVDQHDWSGIVVLVTRGAKLYTIFGMTRADNDLVQIQENVIARTISSLQFTE